MQVTYFSGGWDVQPGLRRSSHGDDNLLVEGPDAVDVLVRHIRERKPSQGSAEVCLVGR